MSESTDIHPSGPAAMTFVAVLILPVPPETGKTVDWYWKPIAGVPFLLRNILNLQRAGIGRLILLGSDSQSLEELSRRVSRDSRVTLKLEHVSDAGQLARTTDGEGILVVKGSALMQKTDIQSALDSAPQKESPASYPAFHIDPDVLESVFAGADRIAWAGFEEMLERSSRQSVEPRKNHRLLIFLEGKEALWIRREEDFQICHEELLKSCGLSNDSFMDRILTRFMSRQLTRLFLKTPLTPNQISFLSLGVGLFSAGCFFSGSYGMDVAGAGLLLLSAWIDCTDGEVARLKFQESKLGQQLDIIFDNVVHVAVFFCIGMGLYFSTGKQMFILFGGLASLGTLVSFFILSASIIEKKNQASADSGAKTVPKGLVDQLANRDFTYFLFLMALFSRLDIFISLTAVGANVFAAYLLYCRMKFSRSKPRVI